MCRSAAQGGRRCPATPATPATPSRSAAASEPRMVTPPQVAARVTPELPRLSRREFTYRTVPELVELSSDGKTLGVTPRPAGMSERAYRDHMAAGPRMTIHTYDAAHEELPAYQRGGSVGRNLDVVSAAVLMADAARRGQGYYVTWAKDFPDLYAARGAAR